MPVTKEKKKSIVDEFRINPKDVGSASVQVALLTEKVQVLSEHLKKSPKDFASRLGLLKMVSRRRRLLEYLKTNDAARYQKIIQRLELRK